MSLNSLVNCVNKSQLTTQILNRINKEEQLLIEGGSITTRSLISSSLAKISDNALLVIASTLEEACRWQSSLSLMGWGKCLLYPSSELSPYETNRESN